MVAQECTLSSLYLAPDRSCYVSICCLQTLDGVSTSGSWPALGEMSQKAKKEGEKSPDKVSGVPSPFLEQPLLLSALSSTATVSQQEMDKKGGGTEGVSTVNELSELEQQKLAGKKKGLFFLFITERF